MTNYYLKLTITATDTSLYDTHTQKRRRISTSDFLFITTFGNLFQLWIYLRVITQSNWVPVSGETFSTLFLVDLRAPINIHKNDRIIFHGLNLICIVWTTAYCLQDEAFNFHYVDTEECIWDFAFKSREYQFLISNNYLVKYYVSKNLFGKAVSTKCPHSPSRYVTFPSDTDMGSVPSLRHRWLW